MSGIIPLVETVVGLKVVEDVMDGGKKKQKKRKTKKVNSPRRSADRRKHLSKKQKKRKGRKTNVIGTKSKNLGEELFGSGKLI